MRSRTTLCLLLSLTALPAAAVLPGRTLTPRQAGPIELGMTLRKARSLPGITLKRTSDGEGVALVRVAKDGREWMTVYAGEPDPGKPLDLRARIEHIEVTSPLFITRAGVRPGMPLAEVVRRYGPLREIRRSEIEAREFASFARAPKGLTFRVTAPNGSAGVYGKGETTRRAAPNARVYSIILAGR